MRKFLQRLLVKPVSRLADKYSSRPDKTRVNRALNKLYSKIIAGKAKKGLVIPFNAEEARFIILSDQHKGSRDDSDIFALSEKNYLAALDHYEKEAFTYINLGDSEELWENIFLTIKRHNKATFEKVTQPTALFYYYKDKVHQDSTVKVAAELEMFAQLATPTDRKRQEAIPEAGTHVIGSSIRSHDVAGVRKGVVSFMTDILHMSPVGTIAPPVK